MIHKNLLLTILFSIFLPVLAWGEEESIDLSLSKYSSGFTIENDGTYTFTGTYPTTAIPTQSIQNIKENKKAVINVAPGKEVTIILEDVNISLTGKNQCPLSAKDAKKITLILKGENILSTKNSGGQCPGLWAPETDNNELIIKNGETDDVLGVLNVQGAEFWPGIGITKGGKGKITINGSYICSYGGESGAGIGSSNGGNYNGTITINGGIISAIGGIDENRGGSAGIGGGSYGSGGIIIINDGIVNAKGGATGAGIGGGSDGSGGTITINSGVVNAIGGILGAGIGGGGGGDGKSITINGGIINATGGEAGAGIGGGSDGAGGTITINGGTVNAEGGDGGDGIGNGDCGSGVTFSTGSNGNAFIVASSIGDQSNKSSWQGIIIENDNGSIYGSPVLSTDAIIPAEKTLTIENSQTLTINNNITLVNLGTIENNSGGTITNNGTILNVSSGSITGTPPDNSAKTGYAVTCDLNYTSAPDEEIIYIESGKDLSYSPARKYYTFNGWYDSKTGGNEVTKIKNDATVYAQWTIKNFTIKDNLCLTADYGLAYTHTFSANELSDDIPAVGGLKSIAIKSGSLPTGLTLSGLIVSGMPTTVNETGEKVTFTITAKNNAEKDIEITFKVNKANLTITSNNKTITKEYDGMNTVTAQDVLKLEGIINNDDISLADYTLTYNDALAGNNKPITIPKLSLKGAAIDKYSLTQPSGLSLTGAITQKALTITPKANQKLYDGEDIGYDVIGAVNNETPLFNGTLQIKNGKVVDKDLSLTDDFKNNYSFTITPDVDIVIVNEETVPVLVKLLGTIDENGAYKDKVTFMPPEGFKIALIRVTELKTTPSFDVSFNWDKPGKYRLTYQLMRISDSKESSEYNVDVTIVVSTPIDPTPTPPDPDPVEPPVSKTYTVTLPSIEGLITDPVAGSYEVDRWSNFSFLLTLDEGYRKDSHPVVTARGETIPPEASTGKYIIRNVRSDLAVEITGIVKDIATGNESLSDGFRITASDGLLLIAAPRAARLYLTDASGRLINTRRLSSGTNRIEGLAAGIYFVAIEGEEVQKVRVK
ncbi:YDG domain-containing protein [Parabacteroides sp.]